MRWVLLAVSAVFAGWSLHLVLSSPSHPALAVNRDAVLRTGSRQIAVLNTLGCGADPRRWLEVSTGPLRDQLQRSLSDSRQKIAAARTCAVGKVVGAAVTAVDTRSGQAQLLAAVEVTLTPPGGAPTVQRKRYEAGLARTGAGWKLTSLTAVPVDAA